MRLFIKFILKTAFAVSTTIYFTCFLLKVLVFDNSTTITYYKLAHFYNEEYQNVILGSSRAQGDLLPSIIFNSKKAFNFGLDGTSNKLWPSMLFDCLINHTKQLIIVNFDPGQVPGIGNDGDMAYYYEVPRNSRVYKNLNDTTRTQLSPFPLYYNGMLLNFTKDALKQFINVTSYADLGASVNLNIIPNEKFNRDIRDLGSLEYSQKFIKEFTTLINQSEDVVIFIKPPIYGDMNKKCNYFEELSKAINHKRVYYLDFSDKLTSREVFYNFDHLSLMGAKRYSELVRDSILQIEFHEK